VCGSWKRGVSDFFLATAAQRTQSFQKYLQKKKKKKSLTHSLSFLSSITAVGAAELDKIITKNEFVLVEFYAVSVR